uniref:Ig-like domain-containing protein n=1 Tax=Salarias fasciatus TaxID=181472 RepID=A0A672I294_SALFA
MRQISLKGKVSVSRPGDNITVYCDCKSSQTLHIVWYRHCTHETQPPLVLKARRSEFESNILKNFPNFRLVKNQSSESYDLLITNMTSSYEGLYYCGTEEIKVEDKDRVSLKYDYITGKVSTRIIFCFVLPKCYVKLIKN